MAESNSHKLGQFIGDLLELAIQPHLAAFAARHNLYLDQKGPRTCRSSRKVTWADNNKNTHDLDFVLERGGSDTVQGTPVAFIETAWRRYTKHSRAKAQEIQGALEPLYAHYRSFSPFKGVVIAGVFTSGALEQLRSLGFSVVFIDYDTILDAFSSNGIDISFDESTSEESLGQKVKACQKLNPTALKLIASRMITAEGEQLQTFLERLEQAVIRKVISVRILGLFGAIIDATSIQEAVTQVQNFQQEAANPAFQRYELRVEFGNGDHIEGRFTSKQDAVDFLRRVES